MYIFALYIYIFVVFEKLLSLQNFKLIYDYFVFSKQILMIYINLIKYTISVHESSIHGSNPVSLSPHTAFPLSQPLLVTSLHSSQVL